MNKYLYSQNKHCQDCGKLITNDAIRCNHCNNKFIWKNPEHRKSVSENVSKTMKKIKDRHKLATIEGMKNMSKEKYENMIEGAKKAGLKNKECIGYWKGRKNIALSLRNKINNPMNNIETRKKASATLQGVELKDWKEFTGYKPYTIDFNEKFKEAIKERDNRCMLCNIGFEDLVELKRQIHVHHIDYDKKNSFPQNCIILCNKCHSLTNGNRKHWVTFFQSLLKEEYQYEYTYDQKIIIDYLEEDTHEYN